MSDTAKKAASAPAKSSEARRGSKANEPEDVVVVQGNYPTFPEQPEETFAYTPPKDAAKAEDEK